MRLKSESNPPTAQTAEHMRSNAGIRRTLRGRRVLMLVENNPYPQDPRVRREAMVLVDAECQVTVIAPARRGQPWRESVNGVRVYRYPAPPLANGFWGYLWRYGYSTAAILILSLLVLFREGFDVIHAANPPDTLVLVAALYKLLGTPFVYDHHDLAPEMYCACFGSTGSRVVYYALTTLERLSCRLADHVIATNQSYKAVEMQRCGVPPERITIVRNGPELNGRQVVAPVPALRGKGKAIIAYVGVMGIHDGVDYLLRALYRLVHDLGRTDFFCLLVGGRGGAEASLRSLTTQLGLDAHVQFTGWIQDTSLVRRYISTADICVVPDPSNAYNDRSTMIKVTEYMAQGKAIVAFDLPEHRITAQEAATYVRPNDELEFARELAQLMDDPARRQRMGEFGRLRIETELAWCYSAPKLLEVYNTLLSAQDRKR